MEDHDKEYDALNLAVASIERLPLAAESVDCIFTDPPYLKEYLWAYAALAREAMRVLKPGGFVLAMAGGAYLDQIMRFFGDAGLTFYWLYQLELVGGNTGIVWRHGRNGENTTIVVRHKQVLAFSKGRGTARTSTVGTFVCNGGDKRYHVWGQDVASARYFVDCFSAPGDTVLDPFIGGGTTAVACELIGRKWIAFDVDPQAIETTRNRLNSTAFPVALPLLALAEAG